MIDIKGLDKAEVLAALFNASKRQGMGFFDERGRNNLDADSAREILKTQSNFDYLHGRVMKIDLSSDELDPWLFDRDNGEGAAQMAISNLLNKKKMQ